MNSKKVIVNGVELDSVCKTHLIYKWVDSDFMGNKLPESFYGLSVNGSEFIDVKDIVERWDKRWDKREQFYKLKTEGEQP